VSMNTFLKVVLLVIAILIALKLLPLTLGLLCLMGGIAVGLLALGLGAVAVIIGICIAAAAVLAPIWIPLLLIFGIIALIKRSNRPPPALTA
jgi:hypothetical protein